MTFMKPTFFETPQNFRDWLERYHNQRTELWVGYYKKATGRASITWPESVDQALCFGWIDGIRKSLGDESYVIRFTPRRQKSIWSEVNLKRINELIELGLVHEFGLAAYERRTDKTSARYAYEQGDVALSKEYEEQIKANPKAWDYFEALPQSYKKPSIWWVMSAKQKETQLRRLGILIECCEKGERIPGLVNRPRVKKKK